MKFPALGGIVVGTLLGAGLGVGFYTFIYAQGGSYLTNDPAACTNCHVMREYYDGWIKSSHHAVAVCNDCHTPHALVPKYQTKAANGWHHSYAFTTGRFPDVLQIKPHNREITEHACRSCHQEVVQAIETAGATHGAAPGDDATTISCLRCHGGVGHPQ